MELDSVLSFVRGIDLSNCNFENNQLPEKLNKMTNLRWLKLDKASLNSFPNTLSIYSKLEFVSISGNQISCLDNNLLNHKSLRVINLRKNLLDNCKLSDDVKSIAELITLDLSYNNLTKIPEGLQLATKLLILNLSNNKIEEIPSEVFVSLSDLTLLDLSGNCLTTVPPQLRRLKNLQTLDLSDNPLSECMMRPLSSLTSLKSLNIKNTLRTINSVPTNLDNLLHLTELDISNNQLVYVPDTIYRISSLKRLNLSHNNISHLSNLIDSWTEMTSLNISFNSLTQLPVTFDKMTSLVRLNLNGNQLTAAGIPDTIGNLSNLQYFLACFNCLESIPPSLFNCRKLKELSLRFNKLTILPVEFYQLTSLEVLEIKDNENFVMPTKPLPIYQDIYDEIDFSYHNILKLTIEQTKNNSANKLTTNFEHEDQRDKTKNELKDLLLQKRMHNTKIIDQIGNAEEKKASRKSTGKTDIFPPPSCRKNNIDTMIEKPNIDYSEIFNVDFGREEGVTVFIIENFLPSLLEESIHGKFYENDCYLVLNSYINDGHCLCHTVYFWIGKKSTIDKKASSAIHAVNLRNFLNANQMIRREEQGEESDEFIALFYGRFEFLAGGTPCGFNAKEQKKDRLKLYRIHEDGPTSTTLSSVDLTFKSLDMRNVFFLESSSGLFIWFGYKARYTIKNKARLFIDKINKIEYKATLDIIVVNENEPKSAKFFELLGGYPTIDQFNPNYDNDYKSKISKNRLYKIYLGQGYLELPQINPVDIYKSRFDYTILETKSVYILDCYSDFFVWIGRKASRLLRLAALSLSKGVFELFKRPSCASIENFMEGNETIVFKSKFERWMDILKVDSLPKNNPNKNSTSDSKKNSFKEVASLTNSQQQKKQSKPLPIDVKSIFFARQNSMSIQECEQYIQSVNEDLSTMECFVMDQNKFIRLPEELKGHFYSGTCYVFLCRYYAYEDEEDLPSSNNKQQEYEYIVYFWEGRNCPKIGWLTFNFGLERKFRELIKSRLEVMRIRQQQESNRLLSHFNEKFVIHRGLPSSCRNRVQFFQIRDTCGKITRRCVEIDLSSKLLNSEFCYILKVPDPTKCQESSSSTSKIIFQSYESGILYFWIGRFTKDSNLQLADLLIKGFLPGDWEIRRILESEEPEHFWQSLNGKFPYFLTAHFVEFSRLFRCSCELGRFSMSEKCSDFSQDDLIEEDAFILDTGKEIFVWLGRTCSDTESKVSMKIAYTYFEMLIDKKVLPQRSTPVKVIQSNEPIAFIQCFQGWQSYSAANVIGEPHNLHPTMSSEANKLSSDDANRTDDKNPKQPVNIKLNSLEY